MTLRPHPERPGTRLAFRTIVVPVDRSRLAEQAIPAAVAIARRARGRIRLVLVHRALRLLLPVEARRDQVTARLAMQKAEREYLRSLTRRLRRRMGRAVSSVMLQGPVARTLATYVRDIRADAVVMTTHGRGGLRRAWLGSVADELIRTLGVPILLMRPGEERPTTSIDVRRVLVPLDGSRVAEGGLEPAAALARLWEADVMLVQIVCPLPSATGVSLGRVPVTAESDGSVLAGRLELARDYLEGVAAHLGDRKLRAASTAVVGGNVAETVIRLARRERADVIAVATHGRGGVRRLVLGSVADKLVRAAEGPVLVCRPRSGGRRNEAHP